MTWLPYGNGYSGIRRDPVGNWICWDGENENQRHEPKYLRLDAETKFELLRDLEAIPKSDLRELIEEWRARASAEEINHAEQLIECANELEAVLEE